MVRILLVGAAFSADLHSDAYARMRDRVQVVAIADKNIDRIRSLAERYGFKDYEAFTNYEEAIAKVECDAVDICMPNFLHCDVALRSLARGRHVISEKPLATTVEDGERMVLAAKQAGKHIYYAEDWLGAPALSKAREIIAGGALGEVKFVRARECHCGSHSPFAQTIRYCGGGCMVHLGVHPVGFMLAMKNNDWRELTAMTSGGGENNLIHKQMEGEDWACAAIRFGDGTVAVLESNFVTAGGMEDSIDFYGTKGCLHVDLTFSSALRGYSIPGFDYTVEKAEITTGWARPTVDEKYNLGYVAEISHFIDRIANNREADVGLRGIDGLETLRVIQQIYRSAADGTKKVRQNQ